MLKNGRFSLLYLIAFAAMAQNQVSEFGFVLDNDLFTSTVNDKYYTNGFEIYYRYLNAANTENSVKKITEFRLGQYIYNPQTILAADFYVNDRPFAGVLFAEVGMHQFFVNQSVLKLNGQIGFMGKNAFSEEVQRRFHTAFGYDKVEGWRYQIDDALLVQAEVFYGRKLASINKKKTLDILAQAEIKVGTLLNEITVGPVLRIGFKKLLSISESNLYDASLRYDQNYRTTSEFYFFISPKLNYQIYDATIQGRLFGDNSPVTFDLIPFRFQGEAGFKYRKNKWNLHYTFNYSSQEVDNSVNIGYYYGSIGIGYLLL
jgi:hypothetical protein